MSHRTSDAGSSSISSSASAALPAFFVENPQLSRHLPRKSRTADSSSTRMYEDGFCRSAGFDAVALAWEAYCLTMRIASELVSGSYSGPCSCHEWKSFSTPTGDKKPPFLRFPVGIGRTLFKFRPELQ